MNRTRFIILNVLACLFLLLTVLRLLLVQDLESARLQVVQAQSLVAQGQQSEQVLRQIILRLAQASQREPDLKDLLKQFNITINNNAPAPAAKIKP
jgi:hypothetical protein